MTKTDFLYARGVNEENVRDENNEDGNKEKQTPRDGQDERKPQTAKQRRNKRSKQKFRAKQNLLKNQDACLKGKEGKGDDLCAWVQAEG